MGLFDDLFGSLFGDPDPDENEEVSEPQLERPLVGPDLLATGTEAYEREVSTKRVDDEGYVYEQNWLTGSWEHKQGLFGPEREVDFFGNPRVDNDWLGNPKADVNWLGEQAHSSSDEPLFLLSEDSDDD